MVQRLLLNNTGLKISRPGVNVTTATNRFDFIFNSDHLALNRLTWGSAVVPAAPGPPNSLPGTVTVGYGTTLTELPFISALVYSNVTGYWEHIGRADDASTIRLIDMNVGFSSVTFTGPTYDRPAYAIRYSVWIT